MIAQPILTNAAAAKSHAQQQQQQPQTQPQPGIGFQSLLAMDSSLSDLAQNTSASAATPAAANTNKTKNANDPVATPYVAALNQSNPPPAPPTDAKQAVAAASAVAGASAVADASKVANAVLTPATDPTAAITDPNAAKAAVPDGTNANSDGTGPGNGNSTAFGADELNARIVAGAPIYAAQPNAAMATVPAHLLDEANAHPLPGQPVGKPSDPGTAKTTTDANAVMPPSPAANASPTIAQVQPAHAAPPVANGNGGDTKADAAATDDTAATSAATTSDPSAAGASLLAQPNAPQTAPVQADAAAHTAAPYVPVGEQVALNIKQAIAADSNEIRIQLKPASLGTIDVKLNVGQDGRVNAVISADRSDTLNMLKQDSGTLQQALRDAGLNADSSSLNFNLRGDAQSFAQNWSQGGGGNGGGGGSTYGGPVNSGPLASETITTAQRLHSGALDIEV